jgi:hypothetical protein
MTQTEVDQHIEIARAAPLADWRELGRIDGEEAARELLAYSMTFPGEKRYAQFVEEHKARADARLSRLISRGIPDESVDAYIQASSAAFNNYCAAGAKDVSKSMRRAGI